ncbi:hypothetical protein K440DRAFT_613614 [Wilcoxina mikolae CBS 423.85]|nr:hypothetical protein K440DRAFT_613614 [Wilcoxina mikolae CBS 423.85]
MLVLKRMSIALVLHVYLGGTFAHAAAMSPSPRIAADILSQSLLEAGENSDFRAFKLVLNFPKVELKAAFVLS